MQRTTLEVNRARYVLPGDADEAAIKESFRRAVRSGGDFVSIPRAQDDDLSVLVTPATYVTIRQEDLPDTNPISDDEAAIMSDLEIGATNAWSDHELDY